MEMGKISEPAKAYSPSASFLGKGRNMAAVGKLIQSIVHQINNPAGFVTSNIESLAEYMENISCLLEEYSKLKKAVEESTGKGKTEESLRGFVEIINSLENEMDLEYILKDIPVLLSDCREGMQRITGLVREMGPFAPPQEAPAEKANINKILDMALHMLREDIKNTARVVRAYGNLPLVRCYPEGLIQVFTQLLLNSVQAIGENGKITIETKALRGMVSIEINDNGKGIHEHDINRVFEPFYTTKPRETAEGLGLCLAGLIIIKHGGSIELDSTLGKGTSVMMKLPVSGPANSQAMPVSQVFFSA